jgi:hypothetical protein
MKRLAATALTVAGMMVLACGPVLAAGGEVRGRFVRRVEVAVGEREYLAIEIEQAGRDARARLLVPQRREDLAARVRRLREGQIVEATYVEEAGQKWVRVIEVAGQPDRPERVERPDRPRAPEGRDRPGPRPGEPPEIRRLLQRILERIERLEGEVRELRAENRRLRGEGGRPRGGEEAARGDRPRREGDRERGDRERAGRGERDRPRGEGDREREHAERGDRDHPEGREGDRPGGAEREGDRERPDRPRDAEGEGPREGELRGRFVRLVERQIGRLWHLGVVIDPDGEAESATLFVPKRRAEGGRWVDNADLAARARRLKAGQRVEITWRREEGQRWIRRIDW